MLRDYGKMLGLIVALLVIGLLIYSGRMDAVAGAGLIGTIIGYLTGNGQNAVTGKAPSPVLVPSDAKVAELAAAGDPHAVLPSPPPPPPADELGPT